MSAKMDQPASPTNQVIHLGDECNALIYDPSIGISEQVISTC